MGKSEQEELRLFIDNDYQLYKSMHTPILKNLKKKKDKKTYNTMGGVRAFQHLVNAGAKKYARENAQASEWNKIFSVQDRLAVARELEKDFSEEYKSGNYDNL